LAARPCATPVSSVHEGTRTRACVRAWVGQGEQGICPRVCACACTGVGVRALVVKRCAVDRPRPAPRRNAPQRHRRGKRTRRQAKGAACIDEGSGTCKDDRHGSMASTQMMSGRAWAQSRQRETRLAHKAQFSPQLEGRDPQHGEGSCCSPRAPWTRLQNGGEEVRRQWQPGAEERMEGVGLKQGKSSTTLPST
jgi:hypothetical protein